jgi:hypothetical protein
VSSRYTQDEARVAVAASKSASETLRRLGMRPAGGNFRMLKNRLETWGITTDHFDPYAATRKRHREPIPLEEILVEGSTYRRHTLKKRLYATRLKRRACEMCGQGENWRGRHMSLILDHINGIPDDNRLENLRIVCPNCAATLDTHCRRNCRTLTERECQLCGMRFMPGYGTQRFCSRYCGLHRKREPGAARPELRRVERPPYEQLVEETRQLGFLGTGRKYGVSDNAIRKWLRTYERERARRARAA